MPTFFPFSEKGLWLANFLIVNFFGNLRLFKSKIKAGQGHEKSGE
jgi:hypothetical protein